MGRVIDCVYEEGVFKPLNKISLREGEKVRMLLKVDRMKALEKYVGIIKLKQPITLEEIFELEDEACLY
jgi:predicted DNA-binding antitoxin AbrB/MazE fold protein